MRSLLFVPGDAPVAGEHEQRPGPQPTSRFHVAAPVTDDPGSRHVDSPLLLRLNHEAGVRLATVALANIVRAHQHVVDTRASLRQSRTPTRARSTWSRARTTPAG